MNLDRPYLARVCISQVIVNYFIADDIVLEKVNSSKIINHALHQFSIFARGSLVNKDVKLATKIKQRKTNNTSNIKFILHC